MYVYSCLKIIIATILQLCGGYIPSSWPQATSQDHDYIWGVNKLKN